MSIEIKIIADNIPELLATCHEIIKNFSAASAVLVDKDDKKDNYVNVEAVASAASETPAENSASLEPPAVEPATASTPETSAEPRALPDILNLLTNAHRNGDADVKAKIVQTRDALNLKFLSHAKDEHREALNNLCDELGL